MRPSRSSHHVRLIATASAANLKPIRILEEKPAGPPPARCTSASAFRARLSARYETASHEAVKTAHWATAAWL